MAGQKIPFDNNLIAFFEIYAELKNEHSFKKGVLCIFLTNDIAAHVAYKTMPNYIQQCIRNNRYKTLIITPNQSAPLIKATQAKNLSFEHNQLKFQILKFAVLNRQLWEKLCPQKEKLHFQFQSKQGRSIEEICKRNTIKLHNIDLSFKYTFSTDYQHELPTGKPLSRIAKIQKFKTQTPRTVSSEIIKTKHQKRVTRSGFNPGVVSKTPCRYPGCESTYIFHDGYCWYHYQQERYLQK